MTKTVQPSDLEFAALLSSKICHDIIGPVSAIYNGLEMIGDDADPSSDIRALDVVRNVAEQASARLQFARFAFGAAGSNQTQIELDVARNLAQGLLGDGKKHQIRWNNAAAAPLSKNQTKLLLNLIACALTALPRGGVITIDIEPAKGGAAFVLTCSGKSARLPQYLSDLLKNPGCIEIDALSVQAYYTLRLANETRMHLAVEQHDADIVLSAKTFVLNAHNQEVS